jgi:3-deoxy-manno-octulosonate cytidylyltransferase (CMP-KDO synthetase)
LKITKTGIIIPARLKSTRLPNKMILDICGKSLIQRVYEQAKKSNADEVIVATDNIQIIKIIEKIGGVAILTSESHQSGTDRIAEAVQNLDLDFIVNLQGDEPLIDPQIINQILNLAGKVEFASAMRIINNLADLNNPNIVKVITDKFDNAIYFSRSPISFNRDSLLNLDYFQHIGIYGYSRSFLEIYSKLQETKLEKIEKLEQLRAIENGYKIKMITTEYKSIGVDTFEDLESVRKIICGGK